MDFYCPVSACLPSAGGDQHPWPERGRTWSVMLSRAPDMQLLTLVSLASYCCLGTRLGGAVFFLACFAELVLLFSHWQEKGRNRW